MSDKIGILDPNGLNSNPLNNKPYSNTYKELSKLWSSYPAYNNAEQTIQNIKDNNVILVISGTGSGKTVLIPKYVLHCYNYIGKIAVILPKQILTESSADFSAKTLDVKLGNEVGFKHRANHNYDKKNTKLLYTTDGSLVSTLLNDPLLSNFDAVIIDEAHERRTDTDFLLYLLREVCIKRPEFKLIIMSATIDETIFKNYFNNKEYNLKYISINISGKTNFPITHIYSKKEIDKNNYINEGINQILEILNNPKTQQGDILFFVPNINETFNVCKQLNNNNVFCVEVFSGMNEDNKLLAIDKDLFKSKTNKKRKVVVATNIAESSLTIDGIMYVIDSGYENFSYYDPNIESKIIEKKLTSQAQIKQRCGRTGRTGEGSCYHLYTIAMYENTEHFPKPLIQTSDIHSECLSLLKWTTIRTFKKLDNTLNKFIEPPNKEYVESAKNKLISLKLVNKINDDYEINKLGEYVSEIPLTAEQSICLLAGWKCNCFKEILMIFTIIEVIKNNVDEIFNINKNELMNNKNKMKEFNKIKNSLYNGHSDHYSLLKIFKKYKSLNKNKDKNKDKNNKELNKWIKENMLRKNVLDKINKYYKKSKMSVKDKIEKYYNNNDFDKLIVKDNQTTLKNRIIISLIKGLQFNIATNNNNSYKTTKIKDCVLSKDTFLSLDKNKKNKYVIFTEMLTINDKHYLQINSKITKQIIDISNNLII